MENFVANDGRTIYYKVVDNYSEKPVAKKGVEKIGRYIHYYDDTGEFIKMEDLLPADEFFAYYKDVIAYLQEKYHLPVALT